MTHQQTLRRKLLSFVRSRQEVTEWMEAEFTWSGGLLELAQLKLFEGFEWGRFQGRHAASVFGICENRRGIPPAEMVAAEFHTESMLRHSLILRLGSAEHYLVVELLSSQRVAMSVCAFCAPTDWYVLEEHLLVREAS